MSLDFDERDRQSIQRDLASSDEDVRRLAVERAGGEAGPVERDRRRQLREQTEVRILVADDAGDLAPVELD